jgi:uncharacterized membrane protein YidH (DUF202 family)
MIDGHFTLDQVVAGLSLGIVVHIFYCHNLGGYYNQFWHEIKRGTRPKLLNSVTFLAVFLNILGAAVLMFHEHIFTIEDAWSMLKEDHKVHFKVGTVIKLFAANCLIGAYLGFLMQIKMMSNPKKRDGNNVQMGLQIHSDFLQGCFRI